MERSKQSNARLRSRNKTINYNHNGLNNLKNKKLKMGPIAKKKLLRVKEKRNSHGKVKPLEYVCSVCNTIFKSIKDFKIHEEHGCRNEQRDEMSVNLPTSDDQAQRKWESIPKLILTRLTPEILSQYIRNSPESNNAPESPITETKIHTSLQESVIITDSSTTEIPETFSRSKESLIEEPTLTQKSPISQTQLRRSSRMSAAAAEGCSNSKLTEPVNSDYYSAQPDGEALLCAESYDTNLSKISGGKPHTISNMPSNSQSRSSSRMTTSIDSIATEKLNPGIVSVYSDSKNLDKESPDIAEDLYSSKILRGEVQFKEIPKASTSSNKPSTKFYECQVCHRGFSYRKDLLAHIVTHPDVKETRYSCSLCENTYHRKQSLNIHIINQHTSLRPYSCPKMCGSSFAYRPYLTKHIKNCNAGKSITNASDMPKESESFPDQRQSENGEEAPIAIEMRCPLCNSVCDSHLALVNHMLRHKAEPVKDKMEGQHQNNNSNAALSVHDIGIQEAFVCLICNKSFTTRQRLGVHKRKHNMVTQTQLPRNEAATDVNVKAIDESTKGHIRGPHRKRKSFMGIFRCSSCDYSTKYFGSLNKHELQVHNRITVTKNTVSLPNFIHCQFCSYATRYKCNMDSHQKRKHGPSLKNSFSCEHCSFSTVSVSDWKSHQLQAHNVRPISTCKKCNFVFASYNELKCHRMKHLRENTSCDANLQTLSQEIPATTEEVKEETEEVKEETEDDCVVIDERKTLHICKVCGKMFARKHFLETHIQCVHLENKLSLTTTNQNEKASLPPNQIIPKSVKKEKRANVYAENQCRLCLVKCISDSALEKHYQRHRL